MTADLSEALHHAQALIEAGELDEARELLTTHLDAAVEASDRVSEAACQGLICQVALLSGDTEAAAAHGERGLEIATALNDADGQAFFMRLLAVVSGQTSGGDSAVTLLAQGMIALEDRDPAGAVVYLERAAAAAKQGGDARIEATISGMLARAYAQLARWTEALPMAEVAFELARKHGGRSSVAFFREQLDRVRRREEPAARSPRFSVAIEQILQDAREAGAEAAIAPLNALLAQAREEGARGPQVALSSVLAQLCGGLDRLYEARAHANEGMAIATDLGDDDAIATFDRILNQLADC